MGFVQDGIHVGFPIKMPILDGMADLRRRRAEHFIHRLRDGDAIGQQALSRAVHTHLEIPDQVRGDPPIHQFPGGESHLQPNRRIQEADLDLVFPRQVAIHIADGFAAFGRPPQMLIDVPPHRVGRSGGRDLRVLEVANQGIHQVPILSERTAM